MTIMGCGDIYDIYVGIVRRVFRPVVYGVYAVLPGKGYGLLLRPVPYAVYAAAEAFRPLGKFMGDSAAAMA